MSKKKVAGRIRPNVSIFNAANMNNTYGHIIARFNVGRMCFTIRKTRINEIVFSVAVILLPIVLYLILGAVFGIDEYAARLGG